MKLALAGLLLFITLLIVVISLVGSLTEFGAYPDWNPFIRRSAAASGREPNSTCGSSLQGDAR